MYLTPATQEGYCFLAIQGSVGSDFYLLGDIFLRNFYAVYNWDTKQIGLTNNYKSDLIGPVDETSNKLSTGAIVGIVIGSIIILLIVVCCICHMVKKKKNWSLEF